MNVSLFFGDQQVRIDAGELIGYSIAGEEIIHQKGSPGWRSSDTEMFPIIGPTSEANFEVKTRRGAATQDQHGLLREMDYACISINETEAIFEKVYIANAPVPNSKYPAKSTAAQLSWPYDFRFRKTFTLVENGLIIRFNIQGDNGMPFMLGYHPAFKLSTENPTVEANDQTISLDEIIAVGNRALQLVDCTTLTLHDARKVTLEITGFKHFMCWTEVPNMVCLEPITFYPYAVAQENLHEGFDELGKEGAEYSLKISVN